MPITTLWSPFTRTTKYHTTLTQDPQASRSPIPITPLDLYAILPSLPSLILSMIPPYSTPHKCASSPTSPFITMFPPLVSPHTSHSKMAAPAVVADSQDRNKIKVITSTCFFLFLILYCLYCLYYLFFYSLHTICFVCCCCSFVYHLKVSSGRSVFFYVDLATRFLKDQEDVELSGLGYGMSQKNINHYHHHQTLITHSTTTIKSLMLSTLHYSLHHIPSRHPIF